MNQNDYWTVIHEEAQGSTFPLVLRDPAGWRSAIAESSGCIHYYRHYTREGNEPVEQETIDYLHICDIDEEIARLKALKALISEWKAS